MKIDFYKYHGTGNDFIMIDGRTGIELSTEQIQFLCDRHFGIGSDGLLIVRNSHDYDFRMQFYNPDGSEGSFCGNGARCIVKFAKQLDIIANKCFFIAKDGIHKAQIINENVQLQMIDVADYKIYDDLIYLNTGTQHAVVFVDDIDRIDIKNSATKIRFDQRFAPQGTNVNFIQKYKDGIKIRTYEKGVEAETLSCGTGVVASSLAYALEHKIEKGRIRVKAKGGDLSVDFEKNETGFEKIFLTAQAKLVFFGEIDV